MKIKGKNSTVFTGMILFGLSFMLLFGPRLIYLAVFVGVIALLLLFTKAGTIFLIEGEQFYVDLFGYTIFKGELKQKPHVEAVLVRNAKIKQKAYSTTTKMVSEANSEGKVYRIRLIYSFEKKRYRNIDNYYTKRRH